MTNEIQPTLSRQEYRTKLTIGIRAAAKNIMVSSKEAAPYSAEELKPAIREYLTSTDGLYLSHPISVIEHSEKSLSHSGAARLQDVISTTDFAQEHAKDLLMQEFTDILARIQEGETIAGIQKTSPRNSNSPFTVSSDNQEVPSDTSSNRGGHHE